MVVKTHDPMFARHSQPDFVFQRVVYLVRNPIDAIWSHFNLALAGDHDRSINATGAEEDVASRWRRFASKQPKLWREHVQHWRSVSERVPMITVRYEDLTSDGEGELQRMSQFLFPHVQGDATLLRRLRCAVQTSINAGEHQVGGYRPRSASTGAAGDLRSQLLSYEAERHILRQTFVELCALGYGPWLTQRYRLACPESDEPARRA
eukprot:Unigene8847_Nuclearia_a/m.27069 Unigene8847_Nuclearia_a/g.27069  ORF Unigene8847_Nuclearia_a/g.27069 Unigene8847_Nuclearia_a/m.27069 type:complete len:207 (-) Unigene8847_Nuclearia_a:102-722(-)